MALLDLCIHVDMSPIEVLLDVDQVSLLCRAVNDSIRWLVAYSDASPGASIAASAGAAAVASGNQQPGILKDPY